MICKKCDKDKEQSEFNETSDRSIIERITTCKTCQSEYNSSYYAANKQRVLENQRYRRKQLKKKL